MGSFAGGADYQQIINYFSGLYPLFIQPAFSGVLSLICYTTEAYT